MIVTGLAQRASMVARLLACAVLAVIFLSYSSGSGALFGASALAATEAPARLIILAQAEDTDTAAGDEAGTPDASPPQDETGEGPVNEEGLPEEEGLPDEEGLANDEGLAEEGGTEEGAADEDATEDAAASDWGPYEPIVELVRAGGPIIVILAILSVISLAIVLVKLVQFRLWRVGDRSFVSPVVDLVRAHRYDDAMERLDERSAVTARVMEAAVRGRRLGGREEELAREEVERVAQGKLDGLEAGLTLLSLIATISPLLGLLGTVLGMIDAFQQLEGAGDRVDPAILSGGIWEALLPTAAGLRVAIPAAAFYTWLQRTVDRTAQFMEDGATQVFCADLYQEPAATAPEAEAGA